jgi:hypothetical protein
MVESYYIVSSLPEIEWDSDIPFTTAMFLADNESALQHFSKNINDIIMLNDLYNLESFLRVKMAEYITGVRQSKEAKEAGFREPCLLDKESMIELIESPEDFPDFVIDYLKENYDIGARYQNIESLYVSYFEYLRQNESLFLQDYGDFESRLRTVIAALRIRKMGLKLDEKLSGHDEIKQHILSNFNVPDFDLKALFPEIEYLLDIFEEEPITREKGIDKIRYDYLHQMTFENPFVEKTIYSFILRLMILERWENVDEIRGREIISSILKGGTSS